MVIEEIRKKLGDSCIACGSTHKLEVHHRYYPEGKKTNGGGREIDTRRMFGYIEEGVYLLLCSRCHHTLHEVLSIVEEDA